MNSDTTSLFEEYSLALEAFAKVANGIIDNAIETNETIIETLEQQKHVLLND